MKVEWFNSLLKDTFDWDYNDVINCVIDYDINNNSDEDGESFWRWEFDCHKLVLCTIELSPSIIIIICKTTLVWFRTTQVWGGLMKFHKNNGNDVGRCLGWKQQHCKACVMI